MPAGTAAGPFEAAVRSSPRSLVPQDHRGPRVRGLFQDRGQQAVEDVVEAGPGAERVGRAEQGVGALQFRRRLLLRLSPALHQELTLAFRMVPLCAVDEDHSELAGSRSVCEHVVVPLEHRGVVLEVDRFSSEGDLAVHRDPLGVIVRQYLADSAAHDVGVLEAGQPLEGRVDLEEAVVDGSAGVVADDLVQREALAHRREQVAIALFAPLERLLHLLAWRDVPGVDADAGGGGVDALLQPGAAADRAVLDDRRCAEFHRLTVRSRRARVREGRPDVGQGAADQLLARFGGKA